MDVSEDELIEAIRKVLSGAGNEVRIGVGDDAAVVAPGSGELVLTTDALVEGTHFLHALTTARDLGYKAVVVNVSDIAAMAASPRYALCALTLSDEVDAAWVMELFGGLREASDEHALWLVGGNLARGSEVSIALTVIGEVAPGRAVTRAGARPGDRLVVTGELGTSSAGLRLSKLRMMPDEQQRAAIVRHQRPVARVAEAGVLARHGATAMIDISDGFAIDLSRLVKASGVGARIELRHLPIAAVATKDDALGGGEDYELLVTMPDDGAVQAAGRELIETFGVPLTDVGTIVEEGLVAVTDDGTEVPLETTGWDHFR